MKKRKKMDPWPFLFHDVTKVERDSQFAKAVLKAMRRYRLMSGNMPDGVKAMNMFFQAVKERHLAWAYREQVKMNRHLMSLGFDLFDIIVVGKALRDHTIRCMEKSMGGKQRIKAYFKYDFPLSCTKYKRPNSTFNGLAEFFADCKDNELRTIHAPKDTKEIHVEMADYLSKCENRMTFLEREVAMDVYFDMDGDAVQDWTGEVMVQLDRNLDRMHILYDRTLTKVIGAIHHVSSDIDEVRENRIDAFLSTLCVLWENGISREVAAKVGMQDKHDVKMELDESWLDNMIKRKFSCMVSGLFWYTLLSGLINGHEVTVDRNCLELLLKCLESPKIIKKTTCDKSLQKFKTSLGKWVAPFFTGRTDEPLFSLEDLEKLDSREAVLMIADHFAGVLRGGWHNGLWENGNKYKKVLSLWDDWIIPFTDRILFRYCMDLTDPEYAEHSLGDLEDRYLDSMLTEEEETWMAENAVTDHMAEDDMVEKIIETSGRETWTIVSDAWAENPHTKTIPPEDRLVNLEQALRDFKNTTVIKPSSVMNAVEYFAVAVEVDPLALDKVTVNETRWYKMKRGRCRILCRKEEDTVLFHVYPRKNWSAGMFE